MFIPSNQYFIGLLCLGGVAVFYEDTLNRQISFYYRIGYAIMSNIIQYIKMGLTSTEYVDNNMTSIFIKTLLDIAKTDVIFVKVLQSIAFNGNFIDKKIHNQITQFSDNVPYDISDIDYDVTMRILSDTPFIFADTLCTPIPIRSGMISLVYALKHKETGEKYIIKVKRKNIDKRVNESINNMSVLLDFISIFFKWWYSFDVIDVISRHLELLRNQLDFVQEEANTVDAYNDLKDIEYLRIPKIYECSSLSGMAIIMEYLPGVHMNNVPKLDQAQYRDLILKYFFASSMIHNKFHGDLHSGNVLFIDNGSESDVDFDTETPRYQLGIIDFGIVMHFPKKITDTLYYVFEHQQKENMILPIAHKYIENFIEPSNLLYLLSDKQHHTITDAIGGVARSIFQEGVMLEQSQFYEIFKRISDNLSHEFVKKHNVRTSDGLVKLEVAVSMCMSLVTLLTDGDPNVHLKRVFDEMFHCDIMFSD